MKSHLKIFAAFLTCATFLAACGKEESGFTSGANAPVPIVRKLEITTDEVRLPQGCLNLAQIFERLQQTPEKTIVREITTDFRIGNSPLGRARPLFIRSLSLKAFLFNETTPAELQRPRLTQNGCESVVSQTTYGAPVEAKIEAWGDDKIELLYESRREVYRLVSPTSLEIVRRGRAMDDCNREQLLYPVQTTTLLRWGSQDGLEAQNEDLQLNFVRMFSEALNESPIDLGEALNHPFMNEQGIEVIQMSPPLLQALAQIDETVATKRCSELPEATPTPASTPVRPPTAKPRSIIDIFFDWFW